MDPVACRRSRTAIGGRWTNLRGPREEREPRPLLAAGVWVVDASEEASPQVGAQPRIARGLLSTAFPGRSGLPSKRFSPAVPLWFVRGRFLRVSRLRPRPTLLQLAVPDARPQDAVPGLQPALSADRQRSKASRQTTSAISKPAARSLYHAKSDGSFSCFSSQTWQSNAREME